MAQRTHHASLQEGAKLLGTWLQGDRALTFCRLLARNTANIKPGHLPGCESDRATFLYPARFLILILALHCTASRLYSCLQRSRGRSSSWRLPSASSRTSRVRSVVPPRAPLPGCSALPSNAPRTSGSQVSLGLKAFFLGMLTCNALLFPALFCLVLEGQTELSLGRVGSLITWL